MFLFRVVNYNRKQFVGLISTQQTCTILIGTYKLIWCVNRQSFFNFQFIFKLKILTRSSDTHGGCPHLTVLALTKK